MRLIYTYFKHTVCIVLYRGCVIVAETVSRLTFHGSKDTSGDGKVRLFAQFSVVCCNIKMNFGLEKLISLHKILTIKCCFCK